MDEEQMQALIRINGSAILYGILRGEIAVFTGSFPGGKFVLPAVYMQDVVKDVETKNRARLAKESKAGGKKASVVRRKKHS